MRARGMNGGAAATSRPLRIASFGFRSLPPRDGSAGADKFVLELLPRIAARGHCVTGYNRRYRGERYSPSTDFRGVRLRNLRTFRRAGLEAWCHAARVTFDIIRHDRADIVHIQNGGNSPFALILRMFGKRTILTEDGKEWERPKWSRLARRYLRAATWLTAHVHNAVVFDNVYAREAFTERFGRRYDLIPYGADVAAPRDDATDLLERLGVERGRYLLFVGRFIPDKGLHHLLAAFATLDTGVKLLLIGGAAGRSDYAARVCDSGDPRVLTPGYLYGEQVHALMRDCLAYVQPSDLEGLSPVILESAFVGAPVICSDIAMNRYALEEHGIYFAAGDADDLRRQLRRALDEPEWLRARAWAQQQHVTRTYSWERVTDQYCALFAAHAPT
ncbi:glycosyltransferase family 4 protein [Sphingomonas sp. RHCKR47]|uniref:glycosyltransferase family 4 protein n=1 Tax=Sphingomonas citricola TaxID=2862498 RepID=UPI001C68359F|nr:glycosyltransferase family 4 protein [Sphingomonas citricola]MBW6524020.1 glycosyltransferase family 4 protein [Sphingomonas citricola]